MNILVVFTHPNSKNSLCSSFLESTMTGLSNNKRVKNVEVLDLYKDNFNPVLVFNDDFKRRDMHKSMEMEKYREQVVKADKIIYIYPIWWGRPPAMLLGYIDKLFATNFAFKYSKGKILPEGLLKGKEVMCISTMKGPTGYLKLFMGNVHKILMKKVLFNFVGINKVKFYEFGSMENSGGQQKKKIEQIERVMRAI